MGFLENGQWHPVNAPARKKGMYVREDSAFRHTIAPNSAYPPVSGRYHLYVAYACPWAHRAIIMRKLKGLEPHIGMSVVSPNLLEKGWAFDATDPEFQDPLYGSQALYEIYLKSSPKCSGKVTVPVLWDKETQTIVNNESAEIVRLFNSAFHSLVGDSPDYYPEEYRKEIDAINSVVYKDVNNGVYRCGFAETQSAYDQAFSALFECLDMLEKRLGHTPFLVEDRITIADWRLFTTLVRFDSVYYGLFKCNLKPIREFPNLWRYVQQLYHVPGIKETIRFDQIKQHYYFSLRFLNPNHIVPKGPKQYLDP